MFFGLQVPEMFCHISQLFLRGVGPFARRDFTISATVSLKIVPSLALIHRSHTRSLSDTGHTENRLEYLHLPGGLIIPRLIVTVTEVTTPYEHAIRTAKKCLQYVPRNLWSPCT